MKRTDATSPESAASLVSPMNAPYCDSSEPTIIYEAGAPGRNNRRRAPSDPRHDPVARLPCTQPCRIPSDYHANIVPGVWSMLLLFAQIRRSLGDVCWQPCVRAHTGRLCACVCVEIRPQTIARGICCLHANHSSPIYMFSCSHGRKCFLSLPLMLASVLKKGFETK